MLAPSLFVEDSIMRIMNLFASSLALLSLSAWCVAADNAKPDEQKPKSPQSVSL